MGHFDRSSATALVAVALLFTAAGCPSKPGTAGTAPSGTAPSAVPVSETEWSAVRVDPKTYKETELGVIAIADRPPFHARTVSGDGALKGIVDEMNALDHVMSTGLKGPGTKIVRSEDQYFRIMRWNWLEKHKEVVLQVRPKTVATARRFRAFYNKEGKNAELGLVGMKPTHYLQILESKEGETEHLARSLREVNGSDGLSVDIPPPSGSPRGSYGRGVQRGTPLFFTLMRDKLLNRENVVLIDESHTRPAELHRVELKGAGLAQISWLEVDIDRSLTRASTPAPSEHFRYEDPSRRLAFSVEGYADVAYAVAPLNKLATTRFGNLPGYKAGATKRAMVAGRELFTIAFRTGTGSAAVDHAVAFWPHAWFTEKDENPTEKGLMVHASAPARGDTPVIETAFGHAAVLPSLDSLFIDPEWAPG
jgi:hypothetical protein